MKLSYKNMEGKWDTKATFLHDEFGIAVELPMTYFWRYEPADPTVGIMHEYIEICGVVLPGASLEQNEIFFNAMGQEELSSIAAQILDDLQDQSHQALEDDTDDTPMFLKRQAG